MDEMLNRGAPGERGFSPNNNKGPEFNSRPPGG
jgi:hypothetical protein